MVDYERSQGFRHSYRDKAALQLLRNTKQNAKRVEEGQSQEGGDN